MKIGDRVIATQDVSSNRIKGKRGFIQCKGVSDFEWSVQFDDDIGGHTGDGKGKIGHCWFMRETDLKLISTPPAWELIIHPDKNNPDITIATLYDDIKAIRHESVKRHYKDDYSVEAAIKAVMGKMYGGSEVKPVGGVREVKRQAVKGEWINITDKKRPSLGYSNGDVLKVIRRGDDSFPEGLLAEGKNGYDLLIYDSEYVVLENYIPPAEPV